MLEKAAVAAVLMAAAGLMGACDSRTDDGSDPPTSTASYRNPVVTPVAADPSVIRGEDGRFYLFATSDDWGDGEETVDAHGRDLRSGGGTLLLEGNEAWVGPGHNSVVADDAGSHWIVYHAIPSERPMLESGANRRPALIDRLKWTPAGWPYLNPGVPDTTSRPAPVIE